MVLFRLSSSTLPLLQKPNKNIFRTECLPRRQSAMLFCKLFASSFQTFPCLVKLFVVDNAHGIFAFFKIFLAQTFPGVFLFYSFCRDVLLMGLSKANFPPLSVRYS